MSELMRHDRDSAQSRYIVAGRDLNRALFGMGDAVEITAVFTCDHGIEVARRQAAKALRNIIERLLEVSSKHILLAIIQPIVDDQCERVNQKLRRHLAAGR